MEGGREEEREREVMTGSGFLTNYIPSHYQPVPLACPLIPQLLTSRPQHYSGVKWECWSRISDEVTSTPQENLHRQKEEEY